MQAESRILPDEMQPALFVVAGYSVCAQHAGHIETSVEMVRALESTRERLRHWWRAAEDNHGEFNAVTQTFADGTSYAEARA